MKRIAVLSDVHANLEALTAVLDAIKREKVSETYCLGDIVGYGASPNECIDLIKKSGCKTIVGNHDRAVLDNAFCEGFNVIAYKAVEWTRGRLTAENKRFLASLEKMLHNERCVFVHANPTNPDNTAYIFQLNPPPFHAFKQPVCFVGHTHYSVNYVLKGRVFQKNSNGMVDINGSSAGPQKAIIDVGSVGQPRDGDARASYTIAELNEKSIRILKKRVIYDIEAAAKKIAFAGLHESLALRLYNGK